MKDPTGYSGLEESEETRVELKLELYPNQYVHGTRFLGHFLRNGEPIGMIRLSNVKEFEWLKERVDGVFDLEDPNA